MPKICSNAKENILRIAKKIIVNEGYEKLTIRDVAKQTGYGVGTIYNYFPNKLAIVASLFLEEWEMANQCLMQKMETASSFPEVLSLVYSTIKGFFDEHKTLFFSIDVGKENREKINFGHQHFLKVIMTYLHDAQVRFSCVSSEGDLRNASILLIQASTTYGLSFEEIKTSLLKLLQGGIQ